METNRKLTATKAEVTPITDKGGEIHVVLSPKTVQTTKFIMGVARLAAGECLKDHFHVYSEEGFIITKGSGKVYIDDRELDITTGTAVLIPQGARHKVVNTGDEELELIFTSSPLAPTAKAGDRTL